MHVYDEKKATMVTEFQFPSNGKAYMHAVAENGVIIRGKLFQFPSNGKAYMHCFASLLR